MLRPIEHVFPADPETPVHIIIGDWEASVWNLCRPLDPKLSTLNLVIGRGFVSERNIESAA